MLSKKDIVCPQNLLKLAKAKGVVKVVIVNAGKKIVIEATKQAVDEGLIEPVFVGEKKIIEKYALDLKWNISKYEVINEMNENNTATIAAKIASENKVKIIVKGHIHTDILMKAVLKRDLNLIGKRRLSHVWHMTLDKNDKPFIITDGALNVLPKLETKMHILKNSVEFENIVAGKTNILLVPNVETGNSLVKMMIYFMGACAAGVVVGGKVPVVITSRADSAPARLASMAAAIVSL